MSIVEVANLAGVSKSTVSRVINQSPQVAPEVAKAVFEAMDRVGYTPPVRRRGPKPLARRGIRTGNVALLVMGHRTVDLYRLPVFPSLLHGVERGLAEQGLNLILANLGAEEALPAVLSGNQQADGLLLFGKWDTMPDSVRAKLRQLPAVWLMREHSDAEGEFDHVFYHNAAVGPMAARYLLKRGHRQVGFLNTLPHHEAFKARQEGFVATLREAGAKAKCAVPSGWHGPHVADIDPLVDLLLAGGPDERPTGLFVPTDAQLPELYRALQERGVVIGKDLDVVSCDAQDNVLSQVAPRPATIDINLELVGRRGVQQLLWRMRHPEQKNRISVLVEPVLVPAGKVSAGSDGSAGSGIN